MNRRARRRLLGCAAALAAALAGCSSGSPKTVPVRGTVAFLKGEPLTNVAVQFVPASGDDNSIANGTTDDKGAFQLQTYFGPKRVTLDGAAPGKYKVVLTPYPRGQRIPQRYGSLNQTPLTADVPEGGVTDLKLTVIPDR